MELLQCLLHSGCNFGRLYVQLHLLLNMQTLGMATCSYIPIAALHLSPCNTNSLHSHYFTLPLMLIYNTAGNYRKVQLYSPKDIAPIQLFRDIAIQLAYNITDNSLPAVVKEVDMQLAIRYKNISVIAALSKVRRHASIIILLSRK